MDDGREICRNNTAGKQLYRQRTLEMRARQDELCCICGLWMAEEETTFDHALGRTAGNHDDRTMADGKRINGAAHLRCNHARGSRKTPYLLQ